MSLLRKAVEDASVDTPENIDHEDVEFDQLDQIAERCSARTSQATQALEELCTFKKSLEALISSRTYSQESAESMCSAAMLAAAPFLKNETKYSTEALALESSLRGQHELALEGIIKAIRNVFDDVFQSIVLDMKHFVDVINDIVSTTNTLIARYGGKLKETREEYLSKKRGFREGNHHLSLLSLWYFFSNKHGPSKDLISDLAFDTEASSFILDVYPKRVMAEMKKFSSLLKAKKIKDEKSAIEFFKAMEGLVNPEDYFDTKYMGEGILFNVTTVERKPPNVGRPISIGGQQFGKLSDACAYVKISEYSMLSHKLVKAAAGVLSIVNSIKAYQAGQDLELTTEEIGKLIDGGEDYVAGAEAYLKNLKEAESEVQELIRVMDRHSFIENTDVAGVEAGISLLNRFADNCFKSIQSPATREIKRALRGAKYCNYVALRMIFNAKPYF